jgi:hypothetical protein
MKTLFRPLLDHHDRGISQSRFAVNNRVFQSIIHETRNRVTRRVLQSIKFSLSRFTVKGIAFQVPGLFDHNTVRHIIHKILGVTEPYSR